MVTRTPRSPCVHDRVRCARSSPRVVDVAELVEIVAAAVVNVVEVLVVAASLPPRFPYTDLGVSARLGLPLRFGYYIVNGDRTVPRPPVRPQANDSVTKRAVARFWVRPPGSTRTSLQGRGAQPSDVGV